MVECGVRKWQINMQQILFWGIPTYLVSSGTILNKSSSLRLLLVTGWSVSSFTIKNLNVSTISAFYGADFFFGDKGDFRDFFHKNTTHKDCLEVSSLASIVNFRIFEKVHKKWTINIFPIEYVPKLWSVCVSFTSWIVDFYPGFYWLAHESWIRKILIVHFLCTFSNILKRLKFTMEANDDTSRQSLWKKSLKSPLSPKKISPIECRYSRDIQIFYRKATYGSPCRFAQNTQEKHL
jgi:hypothetical protein